MVFMICIVALVAVMDCIWELCSKNRSQYGAYQWLPIVATLIWAGVAAMAVFTSTTTIMVLATLSLIVVGFQLFSLFVSNPERIVFVMSFLSGRNDCSVNSIVQQFSTRALWVNGLMMGLVMALSAGIH